MYCQQCGNKIGEQEKFCKQCGAKLQFQENATTDITLNPVVPAISKPILKRRDYFKTVSEKKAKNKIMALNILTCIILVVCGIGFVCAILEGIELSSLQTEIESSLFSTLPTIFIIMAVLFPVLFCIAAAILSVLEIQFKHFGFTIPLLFIGAYPIALSSGGIYKLFGFQIMTGTTSVNGHSASYYATSDSVLGMASQIASLFQLIMYGVLIAMLVLSILVTRNYNKYKKSNQRF